MLRALRFAAVLGFSVESATEKSAVANRGLLSHISAERIRSELLGLLCGGHAVPVLLQEREILAQILPEVRASFDFPQHNPHHCYDVWEHICRSTAFVPPDPVLRMVMLLHDIGKPKCFTLDESGTAHFKQHPQVSAQISRQILTRLRFDNRSAARILTLVREHDNRPEQAKNPHKSVLKLLSKYGAAFFADYLLVRRADTLAQSDFRRQEKLAALDMLEETYHTILVKDECFTLKQLAINGKDLVAAGFSGAQIGKALKNALANVMSGAIPNEKTALLAYCISNKESNASSRSSKQ